MKLSIPTSALAAILLGGTAIAGDGLPDTSFGAGLGHVVLPFEAADGGVDDVAKALTLSDGSVLVVGTTRVNNRPTFTVAKFDSDGAPVQYGNKGIASVAPQGEARAVHARTAALQPDGRLVVAGVVEMDQFGLDGNLDIMVCQFLPDGSLDPQFGGVHTGYAGCEEYARDAGASRQDVPRDMLTDALGRIVIVGHSTYLGERYAALAMRLDAHGAYDTTFTGQDVSANGWSLFPTPPQDDDDQQVAQSVSHAAVALTSKGHVIYATEVWPGVGPAELADESYMFLYPAAQDGFGVTQSPPYTFPSATSRHSRIADLAIVGNRLLLAGSSEFGANQYAAGIAAIDADTLDPDLGFGTDGYFESLLCACEDARVAGMAVRNDGRILLAATALTNIQQMLVARVSADGVQDQSFGIGGTATLAFDMASYAEPARAIALQQDQAIVAGQLLQGNSAAWAITRVTGNRIFRDSFE